MQFCLQKLIISLSVYRSRNGRHKFPNTWRPIIYDRTGSLCNLTEMFLCKHPFADKPVCFIKDIMNGWSNINNIFDIISHIMQECLFLNMFILCVNPWFTATYRNSSIPPPTTFIYFPLKRTESTLHGTAGCNSLAKLRWSEFKEFSHLHLTVTIHIWRDGGLSASVLFSLHSNTTFIASVQNVIKKTSYLKLGAKIYA